MNTANDIHYNYEQDAHIHTYIRAHLWVVAAHLDLVQQRAHGREQRIQQVSRAAQGIGHQPQLLVEPDLTRVSR